MNKIESAVTLTDNQEFVTKRQKTSTYVEYKGFNVGSMFHGGGRKNQFSLSFAPGSELEGYFSNKFEVEKSDTKHHSVVWFDLNNSDDFIDLISAFKKLPLFESSLRKKNEQH